MNEIELTRELRADLPSARANSRDAARAVLLEKIERAEGKASGRKARKRRLPGMRLIHRPRLLAAAAGVLALAVAMPILLLGGTEEGVQSAAAKVLRKVADIAAVQTPEAPGAGQYLFTRSREAHLEYSVREGGRVAARDRRRFRQIWHTHGAMRQHPWWYFVPEERQTWIGPDGSGWSRSVSGRATFLSAGQRAAWVAAGSPSLPRAGRVSIQRIGRFRGQRLALSRLVRLATDPHTLRMWIEAHDQKASLSTAGTTSVASPPVAQGQARTFAMIGALLQNATAPPALRAALYEVASELPGVQLLGAVRDPIGRKGIGVAYTGHRHGERLELIFDPATSTLLGERWVLTSSRRSGIAAPAGTVIGYSAHLATRVVDSAQRPLRTRHDF